MNLKLANSIVITVFLLVGCTASGPRLASSVGDVIGTWKGSEEIADAYQFHEDGTWRSALSVERLDDPYNQGEFWFEGMHFFITYTDGFELIRCGEVVGSYEIELKTTGNLSFVVVEDECQTRVDILQGRVEDGVEIDWAPVP